MENINIELEEMRQQLDVFKKKLDNQNIINDAMMKQIMKGKMSWIKKYVWFQLLVLYPFIVLSWLAFKLWLDFSWWLYVYVIILTGTSVVIDIIVNNTKDSDWGNENLVDTCKKLLKMKKRREKASNRPLFLFELLDNVRRQAEFLIISHFQYFVKTFC